MKEGDWYLISCPFFWTFIGRYVRHLSFQELVLADAIYLTHSGRTFGELCSQGVVASGDSKTRYSVCSADLVLADGERIRGGVIVPAQGPKWPWTAKTPWVKS